MIETIRKLWNSRKAWLVLSGTSWNVASITAAMVALYKGWAPQGNEALTTLVTVLIGLAGQAAGIVSAALVAYEDYALKQRGIHPADFKPGINPRPAGD